MNSQLIVLKILATAVVSIGLSIGAAYAQNGQEMYYEGRSWNQFHDRFDYFKGDASQLCAASIKAWDKLKEVTLYSPKYISHVQGINKDTYEVRTSPPYTFPYILCGASLKTTTTYPGNSHLDSTHIIENFDNVVQIINEKDVTQECQTARENLLQHGTPLPEYCSVTPPNHPQCNGRRVGDHSGVVACQGDEFYPCAWTTGGTSYQSPTAELIIYRCTMVHEQYHIDTKTRYAGYCNDQGEGADNRLWYGDPHRFVGEIAAVFAERRCLIEHLPFCRDDDTCKLEIGVRMGNNNDYRDSNESRYNDYCGRHANSPGCNRNEWAEFNW